MMFGGSITHFTGKRQKFSVPNLQSIFFSDKMRVSYGGWVAQLVEQRIENPRVGGSIPSPATSKSSRVVFTTRDFL